MSLIPQQAPPSQEEEEKTSFSQFFEDIDPNKGQQARLTKKYEEKDIKKKSRIFKQTHDISVVSRLEFGEDQYIHIIIVLILIIIFILVGLFAIFLYSRNQQLTKKISFFTCLSLFIYILFDIYLIIFFENNGVIELMAIFFLIIFVFFAFFYVNWYFRIIHQSKLVNIQWINVIFIVLIGIFLIPINVYFYFQQSPLY